MGNITINIVYFRFFLRDKMGGNAVKIHLLKTDIMVHTFNPVTWEPETGLRPAWSTKFQDKETLLPGSTKKLLPLYKETRGTQAKIEVRKFRCYEENLVVN